MGRLNSQPENQSMINHFSHPHPLHLFIPQLNQTLNLAPCSGCKLQLSGSSYSCTACNYHLHLKCSQAPHQITHPFHENHILTLLPIPSYPNGFFNCDACGKQGNGFSYHCKACEIDLHSTCASMPMLLTHPSHCHQLSLVFSPPYPNRSFSCDICKNIGSNNWLYRCNLCGFDAHLACTMINRQAQQENQQNMPQTSPMAPPVIGIPSGTMSGFQNANQSGNRTVQDQQMIMVQMLQNMRNSASTYTNPSIFQARMGGSGVSASASPFLQALLGGGTRNDMLNTMMGGGVGNPLLQGFMGGTGGGGNDILNAMMGGGGGNNIMQQLVGGGDVGSLLQGMMGGGGNASVLDLLGGAGGGSDLSGLAGALGGLGGFGF